MRGGAPDDPYAYGERIDQVIAWWAERTPDAIAVRQGGRTLSYARLAAEAATVAQALRARGVGPGNVVPTLLDRSPELVFTLLGIVRTGAAYAALDRGLPQWRLDEVIDRTGAALLIADGDDVRHTGSAERITVSDLRCTAPAASAGPAAEAPGGCVVLSAGTAVRCPQDRMLRALADAVSLDRPTRFLQLASPAWEGFACELWTPLLGGGSAVLAAGADPLDAFFLRAAIRDGAEGLVLSGPGFEEIAERDPAALDGLRVLVVTGPPPPVRHLREVLRRTPTLRLVTAYGPAATLPVACRRIVAADLAAGTEDISLGRAADFPDLAVVDEDGLPVAPGAVGELVVGGDAAPVRLPAGPDEAAHEGLAPPGRGFRTGDLARLDEKGNLFLRGRRDEQFVVGEEWIDPSRVEAVLEADPAVESAVVFPYRSPSGRDELVCVYTTPDGRPLGRRTVMDIAAARPAGAQVPTVVHHVHEIPVEAVLRSDPQALGDRLRTLREQVPEAASPTGSDRGVPLLGELRVLLGRPSLRAEDDLLDAGVTSLDVIRLAARISLRSGSKVTVADIYRSRRLDRLPDVPAAPGPPAPALSDPADDGRRPLSHAQKRFLFAEYVSPGEADNLVVKAYLLSGPLAADTLSLAWNAVVRRHQALRTVYPWEGGEPVQRTAAPRTVRWETVPLPDDCRGAPAAVVAERITADWWDTPFRLNVEIPVRARLCAISERRTLLCLHFHHIAFDDWSESLLLADLRRAYECFARGEPPSFTDGPGYQALGGWEERHLADWTEQDVPYWRQTLADCPAPFLPEPGTDGEAAAGEAAVRVGPDVVERLTRAARRSGGPPLASLAAAAGLALGREFDTGELCVGALAAGRFDTALDPVAGYLVNPFALPLRGLRGLPRAVLDSTARLVADALGHTRTPFDEVVRILRPDRRRHPWFQAWVALQGAPPAVRLGPDLRVEPLRTRRPRTAREWMVQAFPAPDGGWELVTTWREDVMDAGVGKAVAAGLERALEELSPLA